MTSAVAVNVAEGTVQFTQSNFDSAASVRNIFSTEDDQTAVAGAAFGIAGALQQQQFGVGSLDGFVSSHDLGTCTSTVGQNADGAELGIDAQLLVDLIVQISDDQADGVTDSGTNELGQVALGSALGSSFSGSADLLQHFCHDGVDHFILHLCFPP